MLIIFIIFFHLVEYLLQGSEPWVYLVLRAIAFAFVKVLTATLAEPEAILVAEESRGKFKLELLLKLLVHIKETVVDDNVFIELFLGKIFKYISWRDGFLKVKSETAGKRS